MAIVSVKFDGVDGLYRISDSSFVVSDGYLHAFTAYWPDKTTSHMVLNPSQQRVADWKSGYHKIMAAIPKSPLHDVISLVVVGGGLVLGGPRGLLIGGSGIFLEDMREFWNNWHHQEVKVTGYYDLDNGELSGNFQKPIRFNDIKVVKS